MSENDLLHLKRETIFKGTGVCGGGKQVISVMGKGAEILLVFRQLTFEEVT